MADKPPTTRSYRIGDGIGLVVGRIVVIALGAVGVSFCIYILSLTVRLILEVFIGISRL